MTKRKKSKKWVLFTSLVFIVSMGFILTTLMTNAGLKDIINSRDSRLDLYEAIKIGVMDDMRAYLEVSNESTYNSAKANSKMSEEVKSILFGGSYNKENFANPSKVSFVDVQYSLEENENFMVYLLVNLTVEDEIKILNFLVTVTDDEIVDVVVY